MKIKKLQLKQLINEEIEKVLKEAAVAPESVNAWLIRLVAQDSSPGQMTNSPFQTFDPNKPPPQSKFGKVGGRGAYEVWQDQGEAIAKAIEAINGGEYPPQQLQRATQAAAVPPPQAWIILAGEVGRRPEPRTAMGKLKGMFGLGESDLKERWIDIEKEKLPKHSTSPFTGHETGVDQIMRYIDEHTTWTDTPDEKWDLVLRIVKKYFNTLLPHHREDLRTLVRLARFEEPLAEPEEPEELEEPTGPPPEEEEAIYAGTPSADPFGGSPAALRLRAAAKKRKS